MCPVEARSAKEFYDLAYAADCAADQDIDTTEHRYQQAITLDPTNPVYRASWINYLQTRARPKATRDAWDEAVAACPEAYLDLHFPVVCLALHRAQLDFAETVLAAVPEDIRAEHFDQKAKMLALFYLARHEELVMPCSVALSPEVWTAPHLSPTQRAEQPITKWMLGVIQCIDEGIHIRGGVVSQKNQEPTYVLSSIQPDEFQRWCVEAFEPEAGQYVELAAYGEDSDPTIRLFPKDETDYFSMPIYPEPDRYIRRWLEHQEKWQNQSNHTPE